MIQAIKLGIYLSIGGLVVAAPAVFLEHFNKNDEFLIAIYVAGIGMSITGIMLMANLSISENQRRRDKKSQRLLRQIRDRLSREVEREQE